MKAAPPPTQNALHEAALGYLSLRPSSVAQLQRVLHRRIDAWARRAERAGGEETEIESGAARARESARAVLERLRASGLLDDAKFAKDRVERLTRSGKSRRAITFDLAKKGVASDAARAAIPQDAATELGAAVAFTRKKRLGAFVRDADAEIDPKVRRRWLGALARAGYSFSVADRALRMDRHAAEELLRDMR